MGPIADAERLGWQRRAARLLAELLELALRDGLPVMRWTVSDAASLVAAPVALEVGQRRTDWEVWRRVVGARMTAEVPTNGRSQLYALAERVDGLVSVAVITDVPQGVGR